MNEKLFMEIVIYMTATVTVGVLYSTKNEPRGIPVWSAWHASMPAQQTTVPSLNQERSVPCLALA